ncbi:MAG TPA: RNA-binding protein [Burkholderiaceae bacterium]|nr:RNA-binding protein [Burkholderiaceae bacterium]
MKPFTLQSRMLTMRGVFYPTGYIFVMLPKVEHAEKIAHDLHASGYESQEEMMLLTPEQILDNIGRTVRHDDNPLPSVGTEGATVHEYEQLALQGHCAVMIHAPSAEATQRVMDVVHTVPFSIAEKYRRLVIEDMP